MSQKELVESIMGAVIQQCRGILADKYALNVDLIKLRKEVEKIVSEYLK